METGLHNVIWCNGDRICVESNATARIICSLFTQSLFRPSAVTLALMSNLWSSKERDLF